MYKEEMEKEGKGWIVWWWWWGAIVFGRECHFRWLVCSWWWGAVGLRCLVGWWWWWSTIVWWWRIGVLWGLVWWWGRVRCGALFAFCIGKWFGLERNPIVSLGLYMKPCFFITTVNRCRDGAGVSIQVPCKASHCKLYHHMVDSQTLRLQWGISHTHQSSHMLHLSCCPLHKSLQR